MHSTDLLKVLHHQQRVVSLLLYIPTDQHLVLRFSVTSAILVTLLHGEDDRGRAELTQYTLTSKLSLTEMKRYKH